MFLLLKLWHSRKTTSTPKGGFYETYSGRSFFGRFRWIRPLPEKTTLTCLKTFAQPTIFVHAHICTAARALSHRNSVGWHYLQSKSCPNVVHVVRATRMMWSLFNLWFKSALRSFWCTLYMDLWCRSMRWNFWFFNTESAPVHKFGPHLINDSSRLWLEIMKRPPEASVWLRHAAAQSLR